MLNQPKRTVAIVTLVLALALAACSSSSSDAGSSSGTKYVATTFPVQPTVSTLATAVERTKAEHAARFKMTLDITGDQDQRYTANGGVSFDTKNAAFLFNPSAAQPGAAPIDTRLVDGKVWVLVRADWFAGTLAGLEAVTQTGVAQTQANPNQLLGDLANVSNVEKVGADTVDGAATTHYRATVQHGKFAKPVDVWVDELGRIVRIQTEIPVGATLSPAGRAASLLPESAGIKIDVTFSDFGTKVDAVAPPGVTPKSLSQLVGQ